MKNKIISVILALGMAFSTGTLCSCSDSKTLETESSVGSSVVSASDSVVPTSEPKIVKVVGTDLSGEVKIYEVDPAQLESTGIPLGGSAGAGDAGSSGAGNSGANSGNDAGNGAGSNAGASVGDDANSGAAPGSGEITRWQYNVSFPDWQDRSMYGANNRMGFHANAGQGKIYLQPHDASNFALYINDCKIDTSEIKNDKAYMLDISAITRNGTTLQISSLAQGTVDVKIPYPTVIAGTPAGAGLSDDAIDLIDKIITADINYGFSSAQIAIVRHGALVYEHEWGNIQTYDAEGNKTDAPKVTKDTLYDLASVTKMFSVNYALQYLATRDEVDINTKIADILGSSFYLDTVDYKYSEYEKIPLEENRQLKSELTIRDLMSHTAGFPAGPTYFKDHEAAIFDAKDSANYVTSSSTNEAERKETLRQIGMTPLMYEPGTKTLYSDMDYMILCYCVERITGKPIDQFLREVFWEPMGLTHVTYNPLQNGFAKENCAATELKENFEGRDGRFAGGRDHPVQGVVHDPNTYFTMGGVSGHAGMFSNAEDLALLASVMLSGGYGEMKYFSRDVIDLFTSIQNQDAPGYGLGWWRKGDSARDYYYGSVADSKTYGHQGFTGTLVVIDPESDMVIVILTNKIHSPVLKGDSTPYSGNVYTTASLGFVPQILEIGRDGAFVDKTIWSALVGDMAADYKRTIEKKGITDEEHPRYKAYKALLQVQREVSK